MAALSQTYPINTLMELTLQQSSNTPSTTEAAATTTTTLRGLIYCTDATSNSIVLKRSLVHTTLSSEITIINADSVVDSKKIEVNVNEMEEENSNTRELLEGVCSVEEYKQIGNGGVLPNVSRKALEERERRAIRLAEESFSHVNQKVSFTTRRLPWVGRMVHSFVMVIVDFPPRSLFRSSTSHIIISSTTTKRQLPKDKRYSTNF